MNDYFDERCGCNMSNDEKHANHTRLKFNIKQTNNGYLAQCVEIPSIIIESPTKEKLQQDLNLAIMLFKEWDYIPSNNKLKKEIIELNPKNFIDVWRKAGFGTLYKWKDLDIGSRNTKKPSIEVIEHIGDNSGKIIVDMPYVDKDSLNITVRGGNLFISATTHDVNVFNEKVVLPTFVDTDTIKATYNNGVLQITFDYDKAVKSRKISVE